MLSENHRDKDQTTDSKRFDVIPVMLSSSPSIPASVDSMHVAGTPPAAPENANAATGSVSKAEDKQPEIYFPAANVARIMKRVLPTNAKLSKESITLVQESACNFISFISSEAGVHCIGDKRKTVTGDDIIFALNSLGFDNYGDVLNIYLQKYRESCSDHRTLKRVKLEHKSSNS